MAERSGTRNREAEPHQGQGFFRFAISKIATDASKRLVIAASNAENAILAAIFMIPGAQATEAGFASLNDSNPSYKVFVPGTSNNSEVEADVDDIMATSLGFSAWKNRASSIRSSGSAAFCVGNLSVALSELGSAYNASAQGASTLLSLIPATGALIGAPAMESWVLFKLMPIAGVLSMLISFGGNVVPTDVNEYEKVRAFEYKGDDAAERDSDVLVRSPVRRTQNLSGSEAFADVVHDRVTRSPGTRSTTKIIVGISIQLFLIGVILFACWFVGSGSVIAWWCQVWGWMYLWYVAVSLSSLIGNLAGVPFSRQWTIRISRAPKVRISDDAPWVVPDQHDTKSGQNVGSSSDTNPSQSARFPMFARPAETLDHLEKGYNTIGKVYMDKSEPSWAADEVFYVIISVKGVSLLHASARILSKCLTIAILVAGTAMFATASLVTFLIALTAVSMILLSGFFGRITALWMAATMMKCKPILHRVVHDREEAAEYIEAVLRKPDMICETMGHVLVSGRCVKRYRHAFRWCHLIGVLASPYDLTKIAMPN